MAKKKTAALKFKSHSTPGHEMDLSTWLVELAMTRKNCGVKLPPRFWSIVQYKFAFMREIKAIKMFIKKYGEKSVLRTALKEYLTTYTEYGQMEVHLQKFQQSAERLALPKDTSEVSSETLVFKGPDLREEKPVVKKTIGMFERLKGIQNDDSTLSN